MAQKDIRNVRKTLVATIISGIVPFGVFAAGYGSTGASPQQAVIAAVFVISAAVIAGAMYSFRRKFWFTGFEMGIVGGTVFAADLLFEVPFEDQFAVASATFMFFVALGALLGAVAEFIHFLHHASHRGRIEHCVAEPEPPVAEK